MEDAVGRELPFERIVVEVDIPTHGAGEGGPFAKAGRFVFATVRLIFKGDRGVNLMLEVGAQLPAMVHDTMEMGRRNEQHEKPGNQAAHQQTQKP